ncbi:collagenase [Spartinivicinus sp. SM1973]|nr:collagenase [Spartinivicinus marinus]MCX4026421.1 collagenase [Spartinivicinus marinus]
MSQSHQVFPGKPVKAKVWGQDPEKATLYYQLVSSPKFGTLSFDNYKGTFTYTVHKPQKNYDEFRFKVWDGEQYSNESVVQFLINTEATKPTTHSTNKAPLTIGHSDAVERGKRLNSWVWAEDKDNDKLTYKVVSQPKHGELKLDSATGKFTYYSAANIKQDIFSYQVFDGKTISNISSVYLLFNNSTSTPNKPTKPGKPTKPNNPGKPSTPDKPSKPSKPNNPTTPVKLYPSHWTSKASLPSHIQTILSATHSQRNSMTMGIYSKEKVLDVFKSLAFLADHNSAKDEAFDGLLTYIQAWLANQSASHFSLSDASLINATLTRLITMPELSDIVPDMNAEINYRTSLIIKGYGTILDHCIRNKTARRIFARQLPNLVNLFESIYQQQNAVNGARGYSPAIGQMFLTLNMFSYFAKNEGAILKENIVSQTKLPVLLNKIGKSSLAQFKNRYNNKKDGYILLNTIISLGKMYIKGEESWNKLIEQNVVDIVRAQSRYPDQRELKATFYKSYVSQTRENPTESCNKEFSGLCYKLQVTEILPYTHQCSNSLKLRYQQLSSKEVKGVCTRLSRQEYDFHSMMSTNWQPVKDDFNTDLELVIFNSKKDYRKYGSTLYRGLMTNNGGYYLEGTPSQKNNQARLFVYEENRFGKWDIRNLQHEYVHYLDGRFNKYGDFSQYDHFKKGSDVVWSTEGLAEYIAWKKDFRQDGINNLLQSARSGIPSMSQVTNVIYGESQTLIYGWAYTLNRFLYERYRYEYLQLLNLLRNNQLSEYKVQLNSMTRRYSSEYYTWTNNLITELKAKQKGSTASASMEEVRHKHTNHMPSEAEIASTVRYPLYD